MLSRGSSVQRVTGSRWAVIVELLGPEPSSVLDLGCRGSELRTYLPSGSRYVGVDLQPAADVIASAERPFPFRDRAFEYVVLADVLEHLDNPHAALDEAFRVATTGVIVLLPNVFTLLNRLGFLAGTLPMKYAFAPDPLVDRHRWILNYEQAAAFTRRRAELAGWRVATERAYMYPFRRYLARLVYDAAGVLAGPNLWSWEYAARVEPHD